jgi:hypothetical protein
MNTNMKKRNYISIACILLSASFYSCSVDSASVPDGIVSGELRDAIAVANGDDPAFWSEQPNGYEIRCYEFGWTGSESKGSQTFWGKADGTFYNCRIFATEYDVSPTNGAFHVVASQRVAISKKETKLTFDVIPYCSIRDVSFEKDPVTPGSLIARFKITTNAVADDPSTPDVDEALPATFRNWRFFASSRTPYVGNNIYDTDVSTNSDQTLTDAQLGTEIVRVFTGFKPGVKYYVRLAARCVETASARYNMTKIYEITF